MQYEITDLAMNIAKLDVVQGDTLFVQSALHSFGVPRHSTKINLNEQIFKQLQIMVGDAGNIVVPTFNFEFCKGSAYDVKETPSQRMGIFSEYVRTLNYSIRSKHPIQSISVFGEKAKHICSHDTYSAFETNSPFDKLLKLDAKVLLLGAHAQAVSFVHVAEEQNNVPYRYWKEFNGQYYDGEGAVSHRSYGSFVRNLEINPILKLNKVERILIDRELVQKTKFSFGNLSLFNARDFVAVVNDKLKHNPNWLIEDEIC